MKLILNLTEASEIIRAHYNCGPDTAVEITTLPRYFSKKEVLAGAKIELIKFARQLITDAHSGRVPLDTFPDGRKGLGLAIAKHYVEDHWSRP